MTDRPNKPVKPRKGQPQRRKKAVQTTAAVFAGAGLTLALVPLLPPVWLAWLGLFVAVVAVVLLYP